MSSAELFEWFLGDPLKIVIVLVIAVISRSTLSKAAERLTKRAVGQTDRAEQRAATISRLLNSIISGAIWTIAIITILAVLGINVGPLLASAGIVGVALGFGAQTLVKDYLSGIFLILEDQYGIGDEVQIGSVRGTVQEVALRTTCVIDADGVTWYIRNGEILNVANFSQNTNWNKK